METGCLSDVDGSVHQALDYMFMYSVLSGEGRDYIIKFVVFWLSMLVDKVLLVIFDCPSYWISLSFLL
jgi:hypothetical protein